MSTITDLYDFDKLYDEDGNCRLCGHYRKDDHEDKCPGEILDKGYWELHATVNYGGCGCGCTPWSMINAHGQDITELAKQILVTTRGERRGRASLELRYTGEPYLGDIDREIERLEREARELEEAREKESERRERLDAYTRSVAALDAEKADLLPEAYERRLDELKDAYKDVL